MSDMIINLHLRETDDGSFLATLKDRPGLEVRGSTAGEAIEKAKNQLQSESKRPKPESGGMEEDELLRQVMVLEHVERRIIFPSGALPSS